MSSIEESLTLNEALDAVVLMDESEARQVVDAIRSGIDNVRVLIDDLNVREGWKVLGYKSWRECVVAEFGQSQAYLYRQLAAAQIEKEISPNGEIGKIPEAHLRPLAKLPEGERRSAWDEAVQSAPQGRMTAGHVENAVQRRVSASKPETAASPAPTQGEKGKKYGVLEPLPWALACKLSRLLQADVAVAALPPAPPWFEGEQLKAEFVNLVGLNDVDYWIELALDAVEEAQREAVPICLVLWVPALVDQDWFRRLGGHFVCFVSATYLQEKCGVRRLQPTALVLLQPKTSSYARYSDFFGQEMKEVGYVWY